MSSDGSQDDSHGRAAAFHDLAPQLMEDLRSAGLEAGTITPFVGTWAVPDEATKAIARDPRGAPLAFVALAPPIAPDIVQRSGDLARGAAALLGPDLGGPVVVPLLDGRHEGLSYAVYAWKRSLDDARWTWRFRRTGLGPALLRWLHGAVGHTHSALTANEVEEEALPTLTGMAADDLYPVEIRASARRGLSRLDQGWVPSKSLVHYDLWKDNILVPPSGHRRDPAFFVIDWGASETAGFPFWDLARLCSSLRCSRRATRRALQDHCTALGMSVEDSIPSLLLSIDGLRRKLEHFPVERFLAASEAMHRLLCEAL